MKILLEIELTIDDGLYSMKDKDERNWFIHKVIEGDLILHSNEVGDEVGTVKVLKHSLKKGDNGKD